MKNIEILGATKKLGSFLSKLSNTVPLDWRFEDNLFKLNYIVI